MRHINPLLRNVYKQNAYFRGNEYIDKPYLRNQTDAELLSSHCNAICYSAVLNC
jgi:hypothetical protein